MGVLDDCPRKGEKGEFAPSQIETESKIFLGYSLGPPKEAVKNTRASERTNGPGSKSWIHHLLILRLWPSLLASLNFESLLYQKKMIVLTL